MKRLYIRSILFNILFFMLSAVLSIAYLPLAWIPHKAFVHLIRFYLHCTYILERMILGLRYEVRGIEYLPSTPPYIIAAKHQSAYETLKLHLLFDDPAVILKRELLRIPLWGLFLKKSAPIAIDRSNPESAIQSIQDGAKRVKGNNRPIVIFPQGTRVRPDQTAAEKPYKIGIARIQEATDLPIVPMATNAGMFWPRSGFWKSGGTVVFEFLPPVPAGMERSALLTRLENVIEPASDSLADEALRVNQALRSRLFIKLLLFLAAAVIGYCALWFGTAKVIETYYNDSRLMPDTVRRYSSQATVSGFPRLMTITIPSERFQTPRGYVDIKDITITGWPLPLPFMDTDFRTGEVIVFDASWPEPLLFSKTTGRLFTNGMTVKVRNSFAKYGNTKFRIKGDISLWDTPPRIALRLETQNHEEFLKDLIDKGFIQKRAASFLNIGLQLYRTDTGLSIPIVQKNATLYVGAFPAYRFFAKTPSSARIKPLSPSP